MVERERFRIIKSLKDCQISGCRGYHKIQHEMDGYPSIVLGYGMPKRHTLPNLHPFVLTGNNRDAAWLNRMAAAANNDACADDYCYFAPTTRLYYNKHKTPKFVGRRTICQHVKVLRSEVLKNRDWRLGQLNDDTFRKIDILINKQFCGLSS